MTTCINSEMREDVQGLRAVAVLAVLLFHLDRRWLPGGFLGVDVFFVISGFVITRILTRETPSFGGLLRFYVRRFRRIVPAYAVVLLATTVAAALLFTARDFLHYWASYQHAVLFTSNQYFSSFGDYFAPPSTELPLLHFWSISVEMQFYLLLPVIVYVLPRERIGQFLPALLLLSLIYTAQQAIYEESRAYFTLSGRIPEFLVGASTATCRLGEKWRAPVREWAAWFGFALLALGFLFLDESTRGLAQLSLVPCVGAALLIAAKTSGPSRVLSGRLMVWIGAISYSIYLWHWPLLAFIRYVLGTYELAVVPTLAWAFTTLFASALSYRLVETRFRSLSTSWRDSAALVAVVGGAVALSLVGPTLNAAIEPSLSVRQQRYAPPEDLCHGKIVGECIRGVRASQEEWLLLGDSHAAQLNLFFDVVGRAKGIKVRVITASNCVTIPGFDVERIPDFAKRACTDQIARAWTYIDQASVVVIAGKWQYHTPSEQFWAALERFLWDMASRRKEVVVFAQIPMLAVDPIREARFRRLGVPILGTRGRDWVDANCRVQRLVAKFPNATFFDMTAHPMFLGEHSSPVSDIYFDRSHLNESGAVLYGENAKWLLRPGRLPPAPALRCGAL